MLEQTIECVFNSPEGTRPVHIVRPDGLAALFDTISPGQSAYLRDTGFGGKAGDIRFLPGPDGVVGAVFGIGTDRSPFVFGSLATQLPELTRWRLEPGDYDDQAATLGFCLGAYRYTRFSSGGRQPASLFVPPGHELSLNQASATWMVRDLINTPANVLGPVELADFTVSLASRHGAAYGMFADAALETEYPTIAAVGRGSARPPRVVTFRWRGSSATDASPLLSLCGKGVCFDTGGYDLKSSEGHGRGGDGAWSGACDHAGGSADPSGGAYRLRREFCVRHCNAPVRRNPHEIRPDG
jgi:leucyl aminopeptidase